MGRNEPAERLSWLVDDWGGEPLSAADCALLYELAPVIANAYKQRSPDTYPDGHGTHNEVHLDNLALVLQWALHDAQSDGDYRTAAGVLFLMQYVKQPDRVPLTMGYLNVLVEVRGGLARRKRTENLAMVEAAAQMNQRWFELNGQFQAFSEAAAAANTAEAVNSISIPPPESSRTS